jgi:predicted DNA binding CopG/RHH family protein
MSKAESKAAALERDWEDVGESDEHVRVAPKERFDAIQESLGLQMISIRLQKALIEDLKFIAKAHGIGYQPLIRDNLTRFVEHEKKQIIRDAL